MREEQYNQMADALRKHPGMLGLMLGLNRVITLLTMAAYPMLLLYLLFSEKYEMLYHTVLVPGVAFVVVSIFRRVYNAPRPYEQMQIRPLIQKEGKEFSEPPCLFNLYHRHEFYACFSGDSRCDLCGGCISCPDTCDRWCALYS